jgi:hypothetical protein
MTFDQLKTGLIFLVLAALACLMPAQSDTWWLLRAGQEMLRSRTVMLHDSFSYTAAGNSWPNHAWLTQVLFYSVYGLGGMPLLTIVAGAFVVGAAALSWTLVRGPRGLAILIFGFGIAVTTTQWSVRAQVVTLACVGLTAVLIIRRQYRWLLPVFLFWANAHTAVVLGIVMLGGATLTAFLTRSADRFVLIGTTAICAAVTLVNPLGWWLWTDIVSSIRLSSANRLMEWSPPRLTDLALLPFWTLTCALVLLSALRWRTLEYADRTLVIMALCMAPLAVRSIRNVGPFALVAAPAVTRLVFRHRQLQSDTARRERLQLNTTLFGVACLAAVVWVATMWSQQAHRSNWKPLGADVVAGIRGCEGNVYNTFYDGGLLIWFVPERKVFVDNRQDPYPLPFLREAYRVEVSGDYGDTFERYRVRCAVAYRGSRLAKRLESEGWQDRGSDEHRVVLAMPGPGSPAGSRSRGAIPGLVGSL